MSDTKDWQAIAKDMIERLRADGVTPGIEVGDRAPDFSLPDANGNLVSLTERLAAGPVVLWFYRGAWCPVCNTEMQALQQALPQIQAVGASLLAISPQAPDASLAFVQRLDLGFDVLSDRDQSVIQAYGLRSSCCQNCTTPIGSRGMSLEEHNADGSWNLPVPATFVIDTTGTVVARHVDPDYRQRMAADELVSALQRLS